MIFVDEAKVSVKGGDGGRGCESFYRDKRMRHPRPDGGDGGNGGNVILMASRSIHTLLDFKYRKHYEAERGGHASSKGKRGKEGRSCVLKVPLGTIIRDVETGFVIRDLTSVDDSVIIAKGGRGGLGNKDRKFTKPPTSGERRDIELQLKIIADVGLLGFPNAGKSTLISSISHARSKIAGYPFTTKQPVLGIVDFEGERFVMADLPGIIEGAHQGRGLGDRFLKHAERTKVLLHLVDMAGSEGRDPLEDFKIISNEVSQYGEALSGKDRIVVANKMDLPEAQQNLKRFKRKFKGEEVISISALERSGLEELLARIKKALC